MIEKKILLAAIFNLAGVVWDILGFRFAEAWNWTYLIGVAVHCTCFLVLMNLWHQENFPKIPDWVKEAMGK